MTGTLQNELTVTQALEGCKSGRAPNWTLPERRNLWRLVLENEDVLEGRVSCGNHTQDQQVREAAWKSLTTRHNSSGIARNRGWVQCRRQWQEMKGRVRRKHLANMTCTGNNRAAEFVLDDVEVEILAHLRANNSATVAGIAQGFDSMRPEGLADADARAARLQMRRPVSAAAGAPPRAADGQVTLPSPISPARRRSQGRDGIPVRDASPVLFGSGSEGTQTAASPTGRSQGDGGIQASSTLTSTPR